MIIPLDKALEFIKVLDKNSDLRMIIEETIIRELKEEALQNRMDLSSIFRKIIPSIMDTTKSLTEEGDTIVYEMTNGGTYTFNIKLKFKEQ